MKTIQGITIRTISTIIEFCQNYQTRQEKFERIKKKQSNKLQFSFVIPKRKYISFMRTEGEILLKVQLSDELYSLSFTNLLVHPNPSAVLN